MRYLLPVILLVSPLLIAQEHLAAVDWNRDTGVGARARIIRQGYCQGDADLFTVALDFQVRITNNSERELYMRSDMVQASVRVAPDLEAASQGRYMYESGGGVSVWSADHKFPPVQEIRLVPRGSIDVRIEGGLVARYKPDYSYPKTVPPGRYALQLLLQPEKEFPRLTHATLKSITVDPIGFEIEKNPHPKRCR
jgi:hypothetical protein